MSGHLTQKEVREYWQDASDDLREENEELRTEVQRLRKALEHIASPNRGAKAVGQDAHDMAAYARQALEYQDG